MKDLLNARQHVFTRERDTPISMAMKTLAIHYASGLRCNLVFKDVSKVLNRLWHLGLKFKIFYCKLPGSVEPLLCDFLDDCKPKVNMGNHQAPPFPLHKGMLQGSILAPTLHVMFTWDCSALETGVDIQYVDEVSQVMLHPQQSSLMLTTWTEREVTRINSFERTCWIITHGLVHCNPFGHPPPRFRFPCNGIQAFGEGLCLPHYSEGYQGVVKPWCNYIFLSCNLTAEVTSPSQDYGGPISGVSHCPHSHWARWQWAASRRCKMLLSSSLWKCNGMTSAHWSPYMRKLKSHQSIFDSTR